MTFCVAVGLPYVGLVAADTRTVTEDGLISDEGELRFKNPLGGSSIVFAERFRKIRRHRSGWLTGAGVLQWTSLAEEALLAQDPLTLEGASTCVREVTDRLAPILHARDPRFVAEVSNHSAILMVRQANSGYRCDVLAPDGRVAPAVSVVCNSPKELPETKVQELMRRYEGEFGESKYTNGFFGMVRATAQMFSEVYVICGETGTVSPMMEMGISRRTGSGRHISQHLPPTPFETLLTMSDEELTGRFTTIP